MSIADIVEMNNYPWERKAGASEEAVTALKLSAGGTLPKPYLDFLQVSNGGEGELPVLPFYAVLWSAEEVIENNQGYEVATYAPGFFGIGSSGGGEMLAFDLALEDSSALFALPFMGMDREEAILVASDFEQFVSILGRKEHSEDSG
ncbi:MAG: SMI1/KNR4 family protein [Candidatus Melainabacteria bacterium]|nr:SMI1/KNR4 family protein [Candidatus Melainabacteria bacterium]